jgi:hypothetical protein
MQHASRQRFADPAQGQRAQGHAELHGGQKVVQIAAAGGGPRALREPGGQHLLDARVADGDQRELGGHKKGVGQNEQAHGDKFEQRKTVHLANSSEPNVRIALAVEP